MKKISFTLLVLLLTVVCFPQSENQAVPYTLADRDRMIRAEIEMSSLRNEMKSEMSSLRNEMKSEMSSLRNEMNARFEGQDAKFEGLDAKFNSIQIQITDIKTFLYWGFGVLFSMMVFLFGFVLWDRRTTIGPVKRENERIIKALSDYSNDNPKLAALLRETGIL